MAGQITFTLTAKPRRFGSVAFVSGGLLHLMGLQRLGGWVAMLGLRVAVA